MGYWTKSKKWAQIYLFLLLLLFFSPLKWKKLPLFFENGPNLSLNNISSAKKIIIITTWTVTQAPLFFIFSLYLYLSAFSSSTLNLKHYTPGPASLNRTLHKVLGGRLKGILFSLVLCVCFGLFQIWCVLFCFVNWKWACIWCPKLSVASSDISNTIYLFFTLCINAFFVGLLLWFQATLFLSSLFLFSLVYTSCVLHPLFSVQWNP